MQMRFTRMDPNKEISRQAADSSKTLHHVFSQVEASHVKADHRMKVSGARRDAAQALTTLAW